MKSIFAIFALASTLLTAFAENPPPIPPSAPGETAAALAPTQPPADAKPPTDLPQVCLDVLMVALPEEQALQLLPELRDPAKVGATQAKLLTMVAQKQATFIDWPQLTTVSGQRGVTENTVEERYPIEFEQPSYPVPTSGVDPAKDPVYQALLVDAGHVTPTTFETRNTGISLTAEPLVSADGKSASIQFSPRIVRLLREKNFPATPLPSGEKSAVVQPVFQEQKTTVTVQLRDGERTLLYVGKSIEPGSAMLLFIGGIKIIPAIK